MAKILIVESPPRQRDFLILVLQSEGHDVRWTSNDNDAIRALDVEVFDMLMTDIYRPEFDGLELIRRVRAHDKDLPVLAISAGLRQDLFLHMAKVFGADAVVSKDELPAGIASAVSGLLRRDH